MKSFQIILITLLLISCNNQKQEIKKKEESQITKANNLKKAFFEFDKVEHFHIEINHISAIDILRKENQTRKEKELSDILVGYYPKSINESKFEKILLKLKFKKNEIDSSKLNQFRKIFMEKEPIDYSSAPSIPTYNDIFIFKMNGKTTGIAEICFESRLYRILGTEKETLYFGQYGDFEKLEKLIK
jgi:hypothetical protein